MLCKFWTPLICLMVLRGFDLAQDMQESERVKFLELLMLAESCYICMRGWEIGEEVTTLRCECPSWARGLFGQVRFRDGRLSYVQEVDFVDR
jgi:hypothetical protein